MVLVRNWWAVLIRGLAAIVFGLIAFLAPGFMVLWLALLFGAYALVDGVFAIIAGIRAAERHERWWPFALEGLASIIVGIIALVMPVAAAIALLYFVAAWAILTGVLRISAAIRLRKEIRGEWFLILNGALSVLLGILIIARPGAGLITLVWVLGAYAIVYGAMLVALSFKLRSHRQRMGAARAAGAR
ncbi:MAG TPA: HdeD family acid-resistance protein [Candidatus Methylomirabilis sp.]|nr:HdeD family acid-resistance protein [Candidatus Methylomirabilis sp.]